MECQVLRKGTGILREWGLDGGELDFEAVDEGGFLLDLLAGLLDEGGGGFVDVVRVHHAGVQGIKLATDGEDALLEVVAVFRDNFGGDVEIEVVVREGEAKTAGLTLAAHYRGNAGEFGDEELIIVDEGVVVIKQGIFFAFRGFGEGLRGGADFGDDTGQGFKFGGRNRVVFESRRPF